MRAYVPENHLNIQLGQKLPIYLVTFAIPVTYFIEILRGIVLRNADFIDLIPSIAGLSICCFVILSLSIARFRKQLD